MVDPASRKRLFSANRRLNRQTTDEEDPSADQTETKWPLLVESVRFIHVRKARGYVICAPAYTHSHTFAYVADLFLHTLILALTLSRRWERGVHSGAVGFFIFRGWKGGVVLWPWRRWGGGVLIDRRWARGGFSERRCYDVLCILKVWSWFFKS